MLYALIRAVLTNRISGKQYICMNSVKFCLLMLSFSPVLELMKRTHINKELAKSAFEILNDLMGDIHGARITGLLAIKKPEIYMTKFSKYIVRSSISIIVLSLRKFDDLWKNQLENLLLKNISCNEGKSLQNEIEIRKIRKFCNVIVAHYAEGKDKPKTPDKKLENLINEQGFNTDEEFFVWTKDVIAKIESVRNLLQKEYTI